MVTENIDSSDDNDFPMKPQKLRKKKLLEKRITIPDIHFNNAGVHK